MYNPEGRAKGVVCPADTVVRWYGPDYPGFWAIDTSLAFSIVDGILLTK
jgi:hypothetical protein